MNPSPQKNYFGHIRTEIRPLLPSKASRILDIGAGTGATAHWLKSQFPDAITVAIEGNSDLSRELAANVDEFHLGDLENIHLTGRYDLVVCLDILEHLKDPLAMLKKTAAVLELDGTIIVSVPNIAHLSVSIPLLVFGRFDYSDEGILDRTHLRFFTEESALEVAKLAGLFPVEGLVNGIATWKPRALDLLTLGKMRHRLAKQFIFSCRKSPQRSRATFSWQRTDK